MSDKQTPKSTAISVGRVENLKPFKPGQSGNPSGISAERQRLREYLTEKLGQGSVDGILEMAKKARSEKVRLEALIWLAEQAVGRAPVSLTTADGSAINVGLIVLPAPVKADE